MLTTNGRRVRIAPTKVTVQIDTETGYMESVGTSRIAIILRTIITRITSVLATFVIMTSPVIPGLINMAIDFTTGIIQIVDTETPLR